VLFVKITKRKANCVINLAEFYIIECFVFITVKPLVNHDLIGEVQHAHILIKGAEESLTMYIDCEQFVINILHTELL